MYCAVKWQIELQSGEIQIEKLALWPLDPIFKQIFQFQVFFFCQSFDTTSMLRIVKIHTFIYHQEKDGRITCSRSTDKETVSQLPLNLFLFNGMSVFERENNIVADANLCKMHNSCRKCNDGHKSCGYQIITKCILNISKAKLSQTSRNVRFISCISFNSEKAIN